MAAIPVRFGVRSFTTMRLVQVALYSMIAVMLASPAVAATRTRRVSTSHRTAKKHAVKAKILGQRTIDEDRASQIQAALIKAGYLSGVPTGHWDSESEAAMKKVQADNGWQTKLVPDSRALIKLGLGPGTLAVASSGGPSRALAPSAQ